MPNITFFGGPVVEIQKGARRRRLSYKIFHRLSDTRKHFFHSPWKCSELVKV